MKHVSNWFREEMQEKFNLLVCKIKYFFHILKANIKSWAKTDYLDLSAIKVFFSQYYKKYNLSVVAAEVFVFNSGYSKFEKKIYIFSTQLNVILFSHMYIFICSNIYLCIIFTL